MKKRFLAMLMACLLLATVCYADEGKARSVTYSGVVQSNEKSALANITLVQTGDTYRIEFIDQQNPEYMLTCVLDYVWGEKTLSMQQKRENPYWFEHSMAFFEEQRLVNACSVRHAQADRRLEQYQAITCSFSAGNGVFFSIFYDEKTMIFVSEEDKIVLSRDKSFPGGVAYSAVIDEDTFISLVITGEETIEVRVYEPVNGYELVFENTETELCIMVLDGYVYKPFLRLEKTEGGMIVELNGMSAFVTPVAEKIDFQ